MQQEQQPCSRTQCALTHELNNKRAGSCSPLGKEVEFWLWQEHGDVPHLHGIQCLAPVGSNGGTRGETTSAVGTLCVDSRDRCSTARWGQDQWLISLACTHVSMECPGLQ